MFNFDKNILHRDASILVIDKPAGIAVHRGTGKIPHLEETLKALSFGLPNPPQLAHRLDAGTSGCLVLGRHKVALTHLGHLFKTGKIKKIYWAIVNGSPSDDTGVIDFSLSKQSNDKRCWWMKVDPQGQESITEYSVLVRTNTNLTLVELRPITGRTHQLRVHCQAMGFPILGDAIYGNNSAIKGSYLHLHARSVTIPYNPKKPNIHNDENTFKNTLGLIAGRGDLPHKIITAQRDKRSIVVIAFEGQTPITFSKNLAPNIPVLWVKMGVIGPILDFFKHWGVSDVTMAGGLTRPRLRDLSVDRIGANWLKTIGINAFKGDNHLLSSVVTLLENEGLCVVPPHTLIDNLFVHTTGVLTKSRPTADNNTDIKHGVAILNALSTFDVGQAIVVHDGCVLGIETIEGTEAMLKHVKELDRTQVTTAAGVFVKKKKINQNEKVDLPTIGPDTIRQVRDAGLCGIAIEAEAVQVLDLNEVIRIADEVGIFIMAYDDGL
eukprot:gene22662-29347_t